MLSSRSCPILAEAVAGKKGGSGSSSDLRYRYLKKRNRTKFWTILLKINLSLFVKYWKSKSKTLVPFYEWNMYWKSRKGYFSTLFTAKMVEYRAGAEAGADIVTSWSWSRVKIVRLHNSQTTGNPLCSFFQYLVLDSLISGGGFRILKLVEKMCNMPQVELTRGYAYALHPTPELWTKALPHRWYFYLVRPEC